MPHYPLAIGLMFQSFFMGGFECSTHRLRSGKRLNVTAATCHDKFAAADYQGLQQQGIYTVREGICWHLIEQKKVHSRKLLLSANGAWGIGYW